MTRPSATMILPGPGSAGFMGGPGGPARARASTVTVTSAVTVTAGHGDRPGPGLTVPGSATCRLADPFRPQESNTRQPIGSECHSVILAAAAAARRGGPGPAKI